MIVLFDLDHTLFKVNTSFQFGRYLYAQGVLPFKTMVFLVASYFAHGMGWLTTETLHKQTLRLFFGGRSLSDLEKLAEQFFDKYFEEMVNPSVETILREALSKGEFTAILSSSPLFLVKAAAHRFGVSAYLATEYQVDEKGRIGAITQCVSGEDKARYVERLSIKMHVPLMQIAAYSDSHLDFPFLETAGFPVAVNPTRKLRAVAIRKQWLILE